MKAHLHLSDLLADELLLDRLASRADVGSEPVAALLSALSRHADSSLRPLPPIRRFRRHRALTALAALVVGASGVGVAAAVNQPGDGWGRRDSLRMTQVEAGGATQPSISSVRPAPAASSLGAVASVGGTAGRILLQAPKAVGRATASRPGVEVPYAAPPAAPQPGGSSGRVAEAPPVSALQMTDSTDHGVTKGSPGRSKQHPGGDAGDAGDNGDNGEMMMLTTEPEPTPAPAPTASPRPSLSAGRPDKPRGAQTPSPESESQPTTPEAATPTQHTEPAVPSETAPRKELPAPSDSSTDPSKESSAKPEVREAPPVDVSTPPEREQAGAPSVELAQTEGPLEERTVEPGT